MDEMDDNQRIHTWLGYSVLDVIPQYDDDPAAMLELVEAVRAKGYEWCITISKEGDYDVDVGTFSDNNPTRYIGCETLPDAVAKAVIALIDSIEGETK